MEPCYKVSVYKVEAEVDEGWGLVFGAGKRVGGAVIGSCSVSASGFRWRAPSSSSGAGSSCSCKAPVLRQLMKGVWKLSITRLPSRPHPWDSFPVSPLVAWPPLVYLPIHPAVLPSGIPPELPAMYFWLFLLISLTVGKIALGQSGSYTSFALNFVK